jgi:hypothetical protein
MWKPLAAVAAAAAIAAAVTAWPPSSSTVAASIAPIAPVAAPTCAARGWPYNRCGALSADGKTAIRLVTADRLPADRSSWPAQ